MRFANQNSDAGTDLLDPKEPWSRPAYLGCHDADQVPDLDSSEVKWTRTWWFALLDQIWFGLGRGFGRTNKQENPVVFSPEHFGIQIRVQKLEFSRRVFCPRHDVGILPKPKNSVRITSVCSGSGWDDLHGKRAYAQHLHNAEGDKLPVFNVCIP